MELVNKHSEDFFERYKEKPEELFEYGPKVQAVADKYLQKAQNLLSGIAEVTPIGSVAYKIPSADVEVAVYPSEGNFQKAIEILEKEFGAPVQKQEEFVRFQIEDGKYEVNIHVCYGREAEVSKKLTKFMLEHPDLIKEYKKLKEKYCYSKREYQRQKYHFITEIIKQIPG